MQNLKDVNLAIASGSEKVQKYLHEMLAKYGADVVLCSAFDMNFVSRLEHDITADVILINMDDSYEEDEDALDRLLEKIDLPILFHESHFGETNEQEEDDFFSVQAINKLASKLTSLINKKESCSVNKNNISDDLLNKSEAIDEALPVILENKLVQKDNTEPGRESAANQIVSSGVSKEIVNTWVLGASIGGPEAVKRFLARIPAELPVAFVLAQHLGEGFVPLLANQLNGIGHFKVKEGISGDTLGHGEVVIVPVDSRVILDLKGKITLARENWEGHYTPSINCVINDITNSFKKQAGVIIFSGMGSDGVLACQEFSERYAGKIWAQSADTCVISSMPDSVREANLVSYSGSPEALALKISQQYMGKNSYIV